MAVSTIIDMVYKAGAFLGVASAVVVALLASYFPRRAEIHRKHREQDDRIQAVEAKAAALPAAETVDDLARAVHDLSLQNAALRERLQGHDGRVSAEIDGLRKSFEGRLSGLQTSVSSIRKSVQLLTENELRQGGRQ